MSFIDWFLCIDVCIDFNTKGIVLYVSQMAMVVYKNRSCDLIVITWFNCLYETKVGFIEMITVYKL